jgi:hypothetical protein
MSHKSRIEKLEELTGANDTNITERLAAWWEGIKAKDPAALKATDHRIIELLGTAQARRFMAEQKPSEIVARVEALMDGYVMPDEMQRQIESLRTATAQEVS